MRVFLLTSAVLITAGLMGSAEEASLAERAEAARKKDRNAATGRTLTNDDLKKAKGNVIFLSESPTPPPAAAPVAPEPTSGDLIRQLDELRGRAARLRSSLGETEEAMASAATDDRVALVQRFGQVLDELTRTHEMIGAVSERMHPTGAAPLSQANEVK